MRVCWNRIECVTSHFFFLAQISRYCLLTVVHVTPLTQQRTTPNQMSDVSSRGHDPIAHGRRARCLAHDGFLFNECVVVSVTVIVIVTIIVIVIVTTPRVTSPWLRPTSSGTSGASLRRCHWRHCEQWQGSEQRPVHCESKAKSMTRLLTAMVSSPGFVSHVAGQTQNLQRRTIWNADAGWGTEKLRG